MMKVSEPSMEKRVTPASGLMASNVYTMPMNRKYLQAHREP